MTPLPLYAYDEVEQQHSRDGHPENRGRLSSTLALLSEKNTLASLTRVPATPISRERLALVHTDRYVEQVRAAAESGGGFLDPDTYVGPRSFEVARAAAGAAVEVTAGVVAGPSTRGMSLMRPPGHHALADGAMGFCLFASVALAARVALDELGVGRVLIVDWDVHHGNGTEAILYGEPRAAFFSTHQGNFYPGTGAIRDTGSGNAVGATLNVPLPPGVSDAGYARIFEEILTPFARRFEPELILVSAGYDAHWRDPLAHESLSLAGFAQLARRVISLADELCNGRLAVVLEGGYDQEVLPWAIHNTLLLLADPTRSVDDPFGPAPSPEPDLDDLLAEVRTVHALHP